ncbi:MAG: indolepyruvate/phenylpyruvate decarboxylase [Cardiobacteriaceae bacterium]|nr:indolepyruvate/phenylpyruvate decarboxylase [Cardiobacteriaceae bacterium]
MNLAEQLLTALKAHGVAEIFGIPGDFALPFFKVIEESGILPCYYLSHEPALGFAADAAARYHSRPSVAAVTYGAGGFNMLNPIAAAYAEKSPVIVLSGGPGEADRRHGLLVHHQAKDLNSQLNMYKEVTCDQAILDDPATAPATIARVLGNCIRHSRPVYLEIPRDKVFAPCDPVPAPPADYWPPNDAALDACVDAILERLKKAQNPVILGGVEIRRYGVEKQVGELAARLGIPLATTLMARGIMAEHPDTPFLGTYLGSGGDAHIRDIVENADVSFFIGVLLTENDFVFSAQNINFQHIILAADGQCSMNYHSYPDIGLANLLDRLLARLPRKKRTAPQHPAPDYARDYPEDDAAITPDAIATLINRHFARHGNMPIAADMGDCFFTTLDIENNIMVAPGFYATMGYGVPAGFGLQAASGARPIVLVGDGAFQMTGWELLNAPRYGWNPIVIVFNNASWEMLRTFQPESAFNDLPRLDFAAIAQSLGGIGHSANNRRELGEAFDAAIADSAHFHIIDARIEKTVLSNTLSRFVAGFKEMRRKMAEKA